MEDSIPIQLGINIQKPIYTDEVKKHKSFYAWAWGNHYRDLYYKPITAKTVSLNSLFGGLSVVMQIPKLHALILDNKKNQLYLLKPLGGSSSFLESKFFNDIYRQNDFKDTYLNDFITDAYTIIHPYMFVVSERLARSTGLGSANPRIFYVTKSIEGDTITEGSLVENKLTSISQWPNLKNKDILINLDDLLKKVQTNNLSKIDQEAYIKMRLFDMLIGDWNKIPENWYWIPSAKGDSVIYSPQVIDRSHAFTKADGVLFKQLLNMIGLNFITNYDKQLKDVKKFNSLAFALDIALTQNSNATIWEKQARILKKQLTDTVINREFASLPIEMQNEETERLKQNLKIRRNFIEDIARRYYAVLQETPVITGTNTNDRFVIEQNENKNLRIRIYDNKTNKLELDKEYDHHQTKEIWIYALNGDDVFEVDKKKKSMALFLIGGQATNEYKIEHGKNVFVYESKSEKPRLDSLKSAKVIIPNDESALEYDYQRLRHTTFNVTPIGIYDSDLGLNLGTSIAYTIYGFRRAPYTRRHQLSYNLVNGFTYQGIFPSYNKTKSLHIAAFIGSPTYFSNFFGFGNQTNGHKDARRNFNRVNISKFMLTPAIYYQINKSAVFNVFSSVEIYKVQNPEGRDRYINEIFEDNNTIFDRKYFINLGATYEINKKMPHFISSFSFSTSAGWVMNIGDPERNFAYAKSNLGVSLKLTDRLTFATQFRGTALFSDKYDFFQAATTELRGFRENRFIGRQSFYQYSDIRLDMGRLQNPFTPLNYGVFAGIDHGRVWYPNEDSNLWHSSYGGGFWLTLFRKFTGKFSYFGSNDGRRFMFELGMGF